MALWVVGTSCFESKAGPITMAVANSYDLVNLVETLLAFCWLKFVPTFCSFFKYIGICFI
jgi:hypothetical protein